MPNEATRILAAALAVDAPDGPAVAAALGIPLAIERRSDPNVYFAGRFDDGPFESADFRLNTRTGAAILVLPPRALSFDDLDFDALGGRPAFRGFQRTAELTESYALDVGRRSLKLARAPDGGRLLTVAVHWAAR